MLAKLKNMKEIFQISYLNHFSYFMVNTFFKFMSLKSGYTTHDFNLNSIYCIKKLIMKDEIKDFSH